MYWYLCAVVASSTAVSDPAGARKLGHASIGLSVAGIIVTVVLIIILMVVLTSAGATCTYTVYGACYSHREYYDGYYCSGVKSGSYCYYD